MITLRRQPTAYHWTIFATFCARRGDAQQAMQILDCMEKEGPTVTDKIKFPSPTIATYTSVLKSFVRAGRLTDALNVKARLMASYQYVDGSREPTDRVLDELKDLQKRYDGRWQDLSS